MKLLICEDDAEVASYVKRAFQAGCHTVDIVARGRDGMTLAASERYDVIVFDRKIPEVDGLTIRASGVKTPVLLLTSLWGSTTGWRVTRPAATTISSNPSPSQN